MINGFGSYSLSLPNEILILIFKYLDVLSLSKLNCINTYLHNKIKSEN